MIILLTGDNNFTLRQALTEMKKSFIQKYSEQGIEQRDGSELTVTEVPQLFQGTSLFSLQRLVIIREASANKALWEALPDNLPHDEETTIVLIDAAPDKRTRTYKWLQKNATIHQYLELSESELLDWVQTQGKAIGIEIAPDVARFLLVHVGPDQWRLYHEIKKLHLAGGPITQQQIKDIIDPNPQASAFDLLDAALSGRQGEVERLVGMISISEDPYRFVGLLTSQVYALALCHAAGGRPATTIAKDAGIHPYVAKKTLATATRLSRQKLSEIISAIATLDDQLKTSGSDPWRLIKVSLAKISSV